MLRLVHTRRTLQRAQLRHVALFGLDQELASYIELRLEARWPGVQVERVDSVDAPGMGTAQLLFCGIEPGAGVSVPTLWLGEVDRHAYPFQLTQWLWKSAAPVTGGRLLRWVDGVLGIEA